MRKDILKESALKDFPDHHVEEEEVGIEAEGAGTHTQKTVAWEEADQGQFRLEAEGAGINFVGARMRFE